MSIIRTEKIDINVTFIITAKCEESERPFHASDSSVRFSPFDRCRRVKKSHECSAYKCPYSLDHIYQKRNPHQKAPV